MMRGCWRITVTLALTLAGCGGGLSQPSSALRLGTPGTMQVGMASWYGPRFHGRLTANGEVYNQYELTAAHRTLPLGARAMVTNLHTRQSIEVRINDRGPYVDDRVIDLSYAAARSIGVYEPGIASVRVEVLSDAAPVTMTLHAVQVGSYVDADKAAVLKAQVLLDYPDAYISPMSTGLLRYYQVRLGPFARQSEALARAQEVARSGMQAIIVEEDDQGAER